MQRAHSVRQAGEWDEAAAIDRVVLDATDRYRRRWLLKGEHGTTVLLDLSHAIALRNGDALVLDDGALVRVDGKPEPLYEIAATDHSELARLAWHLGNRHTEMQITGERLRIRRDHVLADMLQRLGARTTEIEAIFEPEVGAYAASHGHTDYGNE